MKKDVQTKDVNAYIKTAPKEARPMLKQLRKAIQAAAPKAKESISYHIPYYSYHGRLAYFAAHKKWCSFFWISSADMTRHKKELASYTLVGHTLRFPLGTKVHTSLITKLVRARAKANEARKK